jgi:NADH-quinone oxidoreductase subunit J
MAILIVLTLAVVASAMWAVMTTRLLRAVVGLALASAVLAAMIYALKAPMAAVFELSVCAGLIPAIFLSAISVTRRLSEEAAEGHTRTQIRKFWLLPLLVAAAGFALAQVDVTNLVAGVSTQTYPDVRTVLWNLRHTDLLGQIVILMGGALGVVLLMKESERE